MFEELGVDDLAVGEVVLGDFCNLGVDSISLGAAVLTVVEGSFVVGRGEEGCGSVKYAEKEKDVLRVL